MQSAKRDRERMVHIGGDRVGGYGNVRGVGDGRGGGRGFHVEDEGRGDENAHVGDNRGEDTVGVPASSAREGGTIASMHVGEGGGRRRQGYSFQA